MLVVKRQSLLFSVCLSVVPHPLVVDAVSSPLRLYRIFISAHYRALTPRCLSQEGMPGKKASLSLALVKDGESGILHELLVELLEFLQRVFVVLTGALRQNVHLEVGICYLLLVVFLLRCSELVTLSLKFLLDKRTRHVPSES